MGLVRRLILPALMFVFAIVLTIATVAENRPSDEASDKPFPPVPDQRVLHNGYIINDTVISGAQPEGEESFRALRELGVKTIISVDGARPDVETARRFGIRYVHLPITYSTVTHEQGKAIAKAMRELPGPVYVHCHHGKHRSAAAVAVACVYNGMLEPQQAESVLKTFGTGANYTGLWKAARDARPLDSADLESLKVDYVETARIPAMAHAMIFVDRHTDHLKATQKAGWKGPADHPDLDPAHEALQLEEHLREIGRTDDAGARPEDFRKMLGESENRTRALKQTLSAKRVDRPAADAAFKLVTQSCTDCHRAYRD